MTQQELPKSTMEFGSELPSATSSFFGAGNMGQSFGGNVNGISKFGNLSSFGNPSNQDPRFCCNITFGSPPIPTPMYGDFKHSIPSFGSCGSNSVSSPFTFGNSNSISSFGSNSFSSTPSFDPSFFHSRPSGYLSNVWNEPNVNDWIFLNTPRFYELLEESMEKRKPSPNRSHITMLSIIERYLFVSSLDQLDDVAMLFFKKDVEDMKNGSYMNNIAQVISSVWNTSPAEFHYFLTAACVQKIKVD
jgi:hypothetical protein